MTHFILGLLAVYVAAKATLLLTHIALCVRLTRAS